MNRSPGSLSRQVYEFTGLRALERPIGPASYFKYSRTGARTRTSERPGCRPEGYSSIFSTAMNASCGTSTLPTCFIRFLPSFCFSSSLRFREMSPP